MLHKDCPFEIKSADDDAGTFEALVSAFGNVDLVGDRVLPGAFDDSLKRWRESGDPLPIVLSHRHDDAMAHIGVADPKDITATEEGLHVKGRLDIADNEVARQVYKLMKRRSLKEFSFGYTVDEERVTKDGINELVKLGLIEAGPTLKGANPLAQLQGIKSALSERDQEPPAKSRNAAVRRQIQRSRIASRTHTGGTA